jgi:hypothetical protein
MKVTIETLKNGFKVCKGDDEEGEFFETLEAIPPLETLMGGGEVEEPKEGGEDMRINSIAKELEGKKEKKEPKYADMGEEEDEDDMEMMPMKKGKKSNLFGKFKG